MFLTLIFFDTRTDTDLFRYMFLLFCSLYISIETDGLREYVDLGPGGCLSCDDGRKGKQAPRNEDMAARARPAGGRSRKIQARVWFPGKRVAAQISGEVDMEQPRQGSEAGTAVLGSRNGAGTRRGTEGKHVDSGGEGGEGEDARPETPPTPPPMLHVLKRGTSCSISQTGNAATPGVNPSPPAPPHARSPPPRPL